VNLLSLPVPSANAALQLPLHAEVTDTALLKLLAAVLACLLPELALAANPGSHGPSLSVFIAQIIVLLTTGRLLGELMQRFGQPAVMGQLIAGIPLGRSIGLPPLPPRRIVCVDRRDCHPVRVWSC
jgi:hypothetical protein